MQSLARDLGPFQLFSTLYTTAIVIETCESLKYSLTSGLNSLAYFVVAAGIAHVLIQRLSTFVAFILISTVELAFFHFPELANHANLLLFCNLGILMGAGYHVAVRPTEDLAAYWETIAPIMRLLIVVTFISAGFHKLNADFINPESSCIAWFGGGIWHSLHTDFAGLGISAFSVLAVAGLGACALLARKGSEFAWPRVDWRGLLAPLVAMAAMGLALFLVADPSTLSSPHAWLVFVFAVAVLCWQIVEGPMLLIRRFQWVALLFSLGVHASLAMNLVVDFQTIALALLAAFTPPAVWSAWRERAMIGVGPFRINRAVAFFAMNLFAVALIIADRKFTNALKPMHVLPGLIFNLSLLVLLWPIVSDLFSRSRSWTWDGVAVMNRTAPTWLYAVPVAMLAFGMTSHLGLRTAGNFSMFSNLKTEGEASNHLLFGSNPTKVFGYQEDVVEILSIDAKAAEIGHHYVDLNGMLMPVVEFRKLLYLWRENEMTFPITLRYGDQVFTSTNIAMDPAWRVDAWDWEMRLLDFRAIQQDRPNQCRW